MKDNNDIYGTHTIQERSFEILKFLDKVCRQNGFTYYLAYGTLLGSIRHEGFIPWDDDIDIWMPRGDYMKLLEYLRVQNKDERFVLNEGIHAPKGDRPPELQMRILDLNHSLTRGYAGTSIEAHPWIDIFALDTFPIQKKKSYLKKFQRSLFFYKVARCKNFLIISNSFFGKMNKLIYTLHQKLKLFFFLSEKRSLKRVVRCLTKYQGIASEEYFCYAAVYLPKPEKCFFSSDWFGTPREGMFEGSSFCIPVDSHNVLTKLYNNYMELPPEIERFRTHASHEE